MPWPEHDPLTDVREAEEVPFTQNAPLAKLLKRPGPKEKQPEWALRHERLLVQLLEEQTRLSGFLTSREHASTDDRNGDVDLDGSVPSAFRREIQMQVASPRKLGKQVADSPKQQLLCVPQAAGQRADTVVSSLATWATEGSDSPSAEKDGRAHLAPGDLRRSSFSSGERSTSITRIFGRELVITKVHGLLAKIVTSKYFDLTCAAVVVANTCFMVYVTQMAMNHARDNIGAKSSGLPQLALLFEAIFFTFYCCELILKLLYWRREFFTGTDSCWNILDMLLIATGFLVFVDFGGDSVNLMWLRVLQIFKQVLKALRVMKVVRFFGPLRLIIVSIAHSMGTFVYACLMLFVIILMHAIVFTQGVASYLVQTPEGDINEKLMKNILENWGGLDKSLLTLYKAVMGGVPWGTVVQPLEEAGFIYFFLFLLYIATLVIAVLRVITGIFVQVATKASQLDHEKLLFQNLRKLFLSIDNDNSGYISKQEFRDHLQDGVANAYLAMLQLDSADTGKLFNIMDRGGDGKVDINEFITGCQRFKGSAKSIDMATTSSRINHLYNDLDVFMHYVEERLDRLGPVLSKQTSGQVRLKDLLKQSRKNHSSTPDCDTVF